MEIGSRTIRQGASGGWLFFNGITTAIVVVLLMLGQPCSGHGVGSVELESVTTVAEIFIDTSEVRVELETGVPDLIAFSNLFPDEFRVRMGLESEPDEERRRRFFAEDFVVREDGGKALAGELISFDIRQRESRNGFVSKPVVFAVFSYPLGDHPEALSVSAPADDDGDPRATIGFVAYHRGLPITDFCPLTREETVDLDWAGPWRSKFRSHELRRTHESPLGVFLHVEPFEVRVEIMARLVDIQALSDIGVGGLETIPIDLQDDIGRKAAEILGAEFELTIDKRSANPGLEGVDFLDRRLRSTAVFSPPRELESASAVLGLVFLEPMTGYPGEIEVTWGHVPEGVETISAAVVDPERNRTFGVRQAGALLEWKNTLENPETPALVALRPPPTRLMKAAVWPCWIALTVAVFMLIRSLARAAGGTGSGVMVGILAIVVAVLAASVWQISRSVEINEARASEVISGLMHNVYRAFDGRDEETISATLRQSVVDELMNEAYQLGLRALGPVDGAGSTAKLRRVEFAGLTTRDSEHGIDARCSWVVVAAEGHWGHAHERVDRVSADIRVEPVDGVWKITALEPVGGFRR